MLVKEICPKCEQLSYQKGRASKYLKYILQNRNMKCISLYGVHSVKFMSMSINFIASFGVHLKNYANLSYI